MRWAVGIAVVLLLSGCLSSGGNEDDPPDDDPPGGSADADADRPTDITLAQTGRWLAPFDGEVPAVNMVLLNDGRVLYYSGVEANASDGAANVVFFDSHPSDGQSRVVDLSGDVPVVLTPGSPDGAADDLFCSGMTLLPDGRVLAVGSSEWHDQPDLQPFLQGGTDARIFDPATNEWTRGADMLFGRWYPTAITLPDGRALILSGIGSLTNPEEQWLQHEVYDPATGEWTYFAGGDVLLPLYPRVTVVPGGPYKGHLFYSAAGTMWGPFGEHPQQAQWAFQKDLDLADVGAGWSDEALATFGGRQHAASILQRLDPADGYAPRFVTFGGSFYQGVAATPLSELTDLSTMPPTNEVGPPMDNPRWHLNGVLLPTGEVLAVGGGLYDNVVIHGAPNVPVLDAELYDPIGNAWSTLAPMTVPRMYHSTALLLPDGRVLVGGHVPLPHPTKLGRDTVNPQVHETRLEVFEPPYLFRGPRPVLTEVPPEATYAQDLSVRVEGGVSRFVLMHPGATTHAWDADQRGVIVEHVAQPDGSFLVRMPPDAFVAAPGHYMLFALAAGEGGLVPSVAHWVHIS